MAKAKRARRNARVPVKRVAHNFANRTPRHVKKQIKAKGTLYPDNVLGHSPT